MNRTIIPAIAACIISLAAFTVLSGCGESDSASTTTEVSADARCPHQIKSEVCPFCNPEMIDADGFCGAHGVAEALCATCRPFLKVAFREQGDWCDEHKLPESQCMQCDPSLEENIREGEHGIPMPAADAGDITDSAAEAAADAMCEHNTLESECSICNP